MAGPRALVKARPQPGQAGVFRRWPNLLVVMGLLTACDIFHRWDAVVYVNKFDSSKAIDLGTFDTLEECRAASKAKMAELKIGEIGGYVCGENCMVKSGFGSLRMCARTER